MSYNPFEESPIDIFWTGGNITEKTEQRTQYKYSASPKTETRSKLYEDIPKTLALSSTSEFSDRMEDIDQLTKLGVEEVEIPVKTGSCNSMSNLNIILCVILILLIIALVGLSIYRYYEYIEASTDETAESEESEIPSEEKPQPESNPQPEVIATPPVGNVPEVISAPPVGSAPEVISAPPVGIASNVRT